METVIEPHAPASTDSWLLLNAVAEDALALKDVLAGLQRQGHHLEPAGDSDVAPARFAQLRASGARVGVLTVWSRQAIRDERVVALAEAALQADCLVPVRIEELEPPIGFRQAQTFDIVNLTEASGESLGRELNPAAANVDSAGRNASAPARLIVRSLEWALFVAMPILVYAALFKLLMHSISDYITMVAAAFFVVDTALIGVPSYLVPRDPVRSIQKLTHCSRIDLVLQAILAVVLTAFATAPFLQLGHAGVIVLFLSMMCSSAAAVVVRYLVIGLWLAHQLNRPRWMQVAVAWLIFVAAPVVLYGAAVLWLLPGLARIALFFYFALSSTQAIVFGVPGFEPLQPKSAAPARIAALRLTLTDFVVQGVVSVLGAVVLHTYESYTLMQAFLRFGACAALATAGRYLGLRLYWARVARSQ